MVTCRFIGRLGNSMFQTAAAIGHARKTGQDWGVPSIDHKRGQPWESGVINCFPNLPRFEGELRNYHEHPNEFCPVHGMHKDICHYDYHEIPNTGPVCLTGFFQSWKYFQNVEEEVKKVFELPHVPGFEDYVSIHVRRGDYVQYAQSFPPVTEEYLYQAMAFFCIGGTLNKFLFFSDDIAWCKNFVATGFHFEVNGGKLGHRKVTDKDLTIEFSEGRGEKEDMSLMASCGHHIIANSSYSWWGSYLGHNPDKVVVSPSCTRGNWYGMNSGIKKDCVDLLPPTWHQIAFR